MRNITACSVPAGEDLYFSPRDFTVAYTSGVTLTLAGLPYSPVSSQFLEVAVTTVGGAVTRYSSASYSFSFVPATGVLTVVGANFLATDTAFVIIIRGPQRAYNIATDSRKVVEQDPLDTHEELTSLADLTNLNAVTNWPSDAGIDMTGRNHFTLTGKLIEMNVGPPIETIKIQVYGTNDEDVVAANRDWQILLGEREDTGAMVSTIACTTTTVTYGWKFTNCRYRYVRVTGTPDTVGATYTNTFIVKMRATAL